MENDVDLSESSKKWFTKDQLEIKSDLKHVVLEEERNKFNSNHLNVLIWLDKILKRSLFNSRELWRNQTAFRYDENPSSRDRIDLEIIEQLTIKNKHNNLNLLIHLFYFKLFTKLRYKLF